MNSNSKEKPEKPKSRLVENDGMVQFPTCFNVHEKSTKSESRMAAELVLAEQL